MGARVVASTRAGGDHVTGKAVFGAVLIVIAVAAAGCVGMMAPSPQMADAMGYVRQHKGDGARRVLVGGEAELMDAVVESFAVTNYVIDREPHALFVRPPEGKLVHAFYFTPQTADRTDVEILIASNWLTAEQMQSFQKSGFANYLPLAYLDTRLLEADFDPNVKGGGWEMLPLSMAAMHKSKGIARKLLMRGANADLAIAEMKERVSMNAGFLDKPANKDTYDRATAGLELLNSLKRDVTQLADASKDEARFQEAARAYRAASVKPQLPEDARRYKVQAEDAARNRRFEAAADLFAKALQIAPWWPEGHFNRAVILGELAQPDSAILEMKRYLRLVPNAPNARAAQDKIYLWEGQAN